MDQPSNPQSNDKITDDKLEEPAPQPVAESADLPPVMASPAATTTSKKKWLVPLLIVVAILIVMGASAAAYYGLVVAKQPKYVLARAVGNTVSNKEISSAKYEGEFTITDKKEAKTYAGTFTGAGSDKNLQLAASLAVEGTTLKLDVRTINNNAAYLKVDGLKGLSDILAATGDKTLAQSAPFIDALNGQWVSFDQNALKSLGADSSTEKLSLSEEDANKVEQLYKKHFFLEVTKTYPDQKIHDSDSHHYQVKVNRDELYAFAKDLKATNIDGLNVTDEMLSQIKKSQINKYPFELWIDSSKQIINQISGTFANDTGKVEMRMALYDLNKTVNVTKPDNSKTLLEVLGESLSDEMNALEGGDNTEASAELRPLYN